MFDWSIYGLTGATAGVILGCVVVIYSRREPAPPPIEPEELHRLAREAALNRARNPDNRIEAPGLRNRARMRRINREDLEIVTLSEQIREIEQRRDPNDDPNQQAMILANRSLVYTGETGTVFRIIPTLPSWEVTYNILQRIAEEFLPIIRDRGYRVRSVSEFYHENGRGSDADGLDFELGGENRTLRPGDRVEGHIEDTLGYNRGPRACVRCDQPFNLAPEYTIHLRLRDPHDQNSFRPYEDIARTMVHELAHCVERNHEPSFWRLNDEIMQQYQNSRQQANQGSH